MDPEDWLSRYARGRGNFDTQVARALGISANTTTAELRFIVAREQLRALKANVTVPHLDAALARIADEMRDE